MRISQVMVDGGDRYCDILTQVNVGCTQIAVLVFDIYVISLLHFQ